jgi:hypothetical protein
MQQGTEIVTRIMEDPVNSKSTGIIVCTICFNINYECYQNILL